MRVDDKADRLLVLAAFIEKLRPESLVVSWEIPKLPSKESKGCCVLGWATGLPELRKKGLQIGMTPEGVATIAYRWKEDGERKELLGIEAAQQFFGLSLQETWQCFTPAGFPGGASPQKVASYLRAVAQRRITK